MPIAIDMEQDLCVVGNGYYSARSISNIYLAPNLMVSGIGGGTCSSLY